MSATTVFTIDLKSYDYLNRYRDILESDKRRLQHEILLLEGNEHGPGTIETYETNLLAESKIYTRNRLLTLSDITPAWIETIEQNPWVDHDNVRRIVNLFALMKSLKRELAQKKTELNIARQNYDQFIHHFSTLVSTQF
jgi:hypothetical protein